MADIYPPPLPPIGGGGGGGRSPSSPQQACVLFISSEIAWGVQEKRPILRNTVNKIKAIFFILYNLKVETRVASRVFLREFFWQHVKVEGMALRVLRSVERRSKASGYFSKMVNQLTLRLQ
ncbi:MAG: hypothetical protein Q8O62_14680 [Aequorivita sp.]|nr:hypothetical protein [Aequorivita sp.]